MSDAPTITGAELGKRIDDAMIARAREADAYRAGLGIGVQALREFGVIDPKDAESAVKAVMSGVPGYDTGYRAGLEAAAKVAEQSTAECEWLDGVIEAGRIAAAIRAMKDDTP